MAAINSNTQAITPPLFQGGNHSPKYGAPDPLSPAEFSKENLIHGSPERWPLPALPLDSSSRTHGAPLAPVHANAPQSIYPRSSARASSFESGDDMNFPHPGRRSDNGDLDSKGVARHMAAVTEPLPITKSIPYRQRITTEAADNLQQPQSALFSSVYLADSDISSADRSRPHIADLDLFRPDKTRSHIADLDICRPDKSHSSLSHSRHTSSGSLGNISEHETSSQPLQYHHQSYDQSPSGRLVGSRRLRAQFRSSSSASPPPPPSRGESSTPSNRHLGVPTIPRPTSAPISSSGQGMFSRERSPQISPSQYSRGPSSNSRRSPDGRPISYVDLLNVPYPQPPPAPTNLSNAHLRTAVGNNASLLSTKQTLEMYRANVKKTNDPQIQYEFAVFMVNTAQEAAAKNGQEDEIQRQSSFQSARDEVYNPSSVGARADLLREARNILQRLSDRSYPFAQYYLADGYASGLFNKGVEDSDRAFPLFISASKHGHAEAGYRAALCYEFGWGTRKDPQKAVQFYRQSASKNHPGAMTRLGNACLQGDLGLVSRYREGLKWLKRASESADYQYNSAPYELGLLHETGYGDDIFQDESYAAQLFTQSADLGHMEANYRLGNAYEHGKLGCPRDPALSVHFYTGAAQRGHPLAMMALCAWYMVGAEPVLEKDENEAYEWARKAAECGKSRPSA